jgi:hypothetical protein
MESVPEGNMINKKPIIHRTYLHNIPVELVVYEDGYIVRLMTSVYSMVDTVFEFKRDETENYEEELEKMKFAFNKS